MRLARVRADVPAAADEIARLASTGQLDLLQLDCEFTPQAYAAGFFEHFRKVHKYLFLEPSLRLMTNAGGGAVADCAEAVGTYLREHGDGGMLVAAIRGDNLFPRLMELADDGVDWVDEASGEPLPLATKSLLAAHVELGGGPLATAWDEGARVVIVGSYDSAAPFLGATQSEFAFGWDQFDALACIAAAAEAAKGNWIAEVEHPERILLEFHVPQESLVNRARDTLLRPQPVQRADVVCDLSGLKVHDAEPGMVAITDARGGPPSGEWRVRFTYSAAHVVDSAPAFDVRWARVPREAVAISVDTRPAKDWF